MTKSVALAVLIGLVLFGGASALEFYGLSAPSGAENSRDIPGGRKLLIIVAIVGLFALVGGLMEALAPAMERRSHWWWRVPMLSVGAAMLAFAISWDIFIPGAAGGSLALVALFFGWRD